LAPTGDIARGCMHARAKREEATKIGLHALHFGKKADCLHALYIGMEGVYFLCKIDPIEMKALQGCPFFKDDRNKTTGLLCTLMQV
jgi:hypothetical protein